ncbi:hypothetical protein BDR07DRAFT_1611846 [Suillus spraguei]|nr:hypothetical protein BDR07DRAFT_1611846 [Suillus spraguei]
MSDTESTEIINILASEIALKTTNDVHRLDHKSRKIPKPKGQAGRSPPHGYNLQEAMGLTGRNRRYNKFRARPLRIEHPFLQRFENAWPMRDMIGQFLWHSSVDSKHCSIILGDDDNDDSTDSDDSESEDGDDMDEEDSHGNEYEMYLGQLANEPGNHPSTSNTRKGTWANFRPFYIILYHCHSATCLCVLTEVRK